MKGYMTVIQYARKMDKHPQTIYRLIWMGKLHAIKVGQMWLIPIE